MSQAGIVLLVLAIAAVVLLSVTRREDFSEGSFFRGRGSRLVQVWSQKWAGSSTLLGTGLVLSPGVIITSAHCFDGLEDEEKIYCVIGTETIEAKHVAIHERFSTVPHRSLSKPGYRLDLCNKLWDRVRTMKGPGPWANRQGIYDLVEHGLCDLALVFVPAEEGPVKDEQFTFIPQQDTSTYPWYGNKGASNIVDFLRRREVSSPILSDPKNLELMLLPDLQKMPATAISAEYILRLAFHQAVAILQNHLQSRL